MSNFKAQELVVEIKQNMHNISQNASENCQSPGSWELMIQALFLKSLGELIFMVSLYWVGI